MALNIGLLKPSRELVNYNFADIADGTGIVLYYGAKGNSAEYLTTPQATIYSGKIATANSAGMTQTFVKHLDIDFDLTFNKPKNVKGVITANIPAGMFATQGVSKSFLFYVVVNFYHWDGSSETLIGTGTSQQEAASDLNIGGNTNDNFVALCMTDAPLTHFKKGETLRFSVELWAKSSSAGTNNAGTVMGHDPKNRNFTEGQSTMGTAPTQMLFQVPSVLDV